MRNPWATNTLCLQEGRCTKALLGPVSGTFNNISKDARISLSKLYQNENHPLYIERENNTLEIEMLLLCHFLVVE